MNNQIVPLLNEYFYNNRNIKVFDLLQPLMVYVPGYTVEADTYVGVVCKPLA